MSIMNSNGITNLDTSLEVNFVANAGIKDIVGRGLIYNDNVAIIELIKNSKDAKSSKVILSFNKREIGSNNSVSTIIVKDFGSGMSRSDLKNKWLNIAYSEKKNKRDSVYAGNKGVGRFSCDRLGSMLELYTKSPTDEYLRLSIDWTLFENRGQNEVISDVPLKVEILDKNIFLKHINENYFNQGTVLVIKNLRSNWEESKIRRLITEIEKFSPTLDDSFEVFFESNIDFSNKELQNKTNKKINNNILKKLSFRTTHIQSNIDEDGKYITTSLYFQGEKIYFYKAINPYSSLKNINIEVHYLDSLSKSYFTKSFGIKPNNYGSIFLFYNSFRISPYGNEKNDWLGLDQRKSQGTSRNFGTRDIIGRVNINDQNDSFSVITSREGLAHNQAYYELVAYDVEEKVTLKNQRKEYGYITTIIRQLESFVVKGTDWNRLIDVLGKKNVVSSEDVMKNPNRFITKSLSEESVKSEVHKIIKSNFELVDVEINYEIISKIQSINEEKFHRFLNDFLKSTKDKSLDELSSKEKGIVRKIIDTSNKKIHQANKEIIEAKIENENTKKVLTIEKKKQAYLLATRRTLSPDADGLIHTIKLNSIEIKEGIDYLIDLIEHDEIDSNELIKKLSAIKLYSVKSLKMTEIATRSGFDKDIDIRNVNIVQYIKEYSVIYLQTLGNRNISIDITDNNIEYFKSVSVLNLSIVLDNLFSNAIKWNADRIAITYTEIDNRLNMVISDNGNGISNLFLENPERIFELGARDEPPTGVSGSGIGLFYSRELLKEMNASIEFIGNDIQLSGASFEVIFQ